MRIKPAKFEPGHAYIIRENGFTKRAFPHFAKLLVEGCSGLAVLRKSETKAEALEGMPGSPTVFWITEVAGKNFFHPNKRNTLLVAIIGFLKKNQKPVVLIDCFETLNLYNEVGLFQESMRWLDSISDHVLGAKGILLLAIDPRCFKDRERAIIERMAYKVI